MAKARMKGAVWSFRQGRRYFRGMVVMMGLFQRNWPQEGAEGPEMDQLI